LVELAKRGRRRRRRRRRRGRDKEDPPAMHFCFLIDTATTSALAQRALFPTDHLEGHARQRGQNTQRPPPKTLPPTEVPPSPTRGLAAMDGEVGLDR